MIYIYNYCVEICPPYPHYRPLYEIKKNYLHKRAKQITQYIVQIGICDPICSLVTLIVPILFGSVPTHTKKKCFSHAKRVHVLSAKTVPKTPLRVAVAGRINNTWYFLLQKFARTSFVKNTTCSYPGNQLFYS